MSVNQSQVDQILGAATADDPEAKLENLEREVDVLKASVKKLLIDIRERMNEMENPFTLGVQGGFQPARVEEAVEKEEEVEESPAQPAAKTPLPAPAPQAPQGIPADLLAGLQAQIAAADALVPKAPAKAEKLRLQKVHNLFEWTGKAVKKYGFDRLEMMLDSYATMGYLERDEVAQVREIARLMPASLGEADEMKAEDFVSELYVLNRILDPTDTSLDRDMIAVLMDNKRAKGAPPKGGRKESEPGEDWLESLERI
ncbi:hypothetical protein Metli_1235 [Methanofollis liminatans DSM 4140]|uniref:Flagella protein n=1 Tax=Methanofollis liminatans DSM 4140 TaxID=28892 RepID=J0S020_9EURY|nr:hypothetical protein [Methanofollis liminatans]EJG07191.1 hypothetical protein Metli_1235 [Methanofollis liminatans DSM 4140]